MSRRDESESDSSSSCVSSDSESSSSCVSSDSDKEAASSGQDESDDDAGAVMQGDASNPSCVESEEDAMEDDLNVGEKATLTEGTQDYLVLDQPGATPRAIASARQLSLAASVDSIVSDDSCCSQAELGTAGPLLRQSSRSGARVEHNSGEAGLLNQDKQMQPIQDEERHYGYVSEEDMPIMQRNRLKNAESQSHVPCATRQYGMLEQDALCKEKESGSDAAKLRTPSCNQEVGGAHLAALDGLSGPNDRASESQKHELKDKNDESDLESTFFDSDSDSGSDLVGRRAAGGQTLDLELPFPTQRLTADEFKRTSPWKLSYIRHLLMNRKWQNTKVESNKNKRKGQVRLTLTRLDGAQFPLSKNDRIFYILYGDNGLEAIQVESIDFKVPASDSFDLRSKQKNQKQWCVTYTRALCTELALRECKSDSNFYGSFSPGTGRSCSLGADSLRRCLEQQTRAHLNRLVFHKGDAPRESLAAYIVGFLAWESVPCAPISQEDEKNLLRAAKESLTLPSSGSILFKNLNEIDWVYCGQDFSDQLLE
jgi:hypothetical protein